MWIFVLLFILIILIILTIIIKSCTSSDNVRKINACVSKADVKCEVDYETKKLLNNIEESKQTINKAIKEANSTINKTWINSYDKVLKVSKSLDSNLKYQTKRHLNRSKFQYYTSLHYRSMIAADIIYKEYTAINKDFNEINKLIVDIAKGAKESKMTKSQIYAVKDSLKELRSAYLTQLHSLNAKTAELRDKIGNECGREGEEWRKKILKNRM